LGAIAALNVTASADTLITPTDGNGTSLGEAHYFPDLLVRVEAALALGRALPSKSFRGSTEVVPALASVVMPTGKRAFMVVDPESASREWMETDLSNDGSLVIASERLSDALTRAHKEVTHLDGIFLASDMRQPTTTEALRTLASDTRFALTPVVILIKEGDQLERILQRLEARIMPVGSVFVLTDADGKVDPKLGEQALAELKLVAEAVGQREMSAEMQQWLALRAMKTLEGIARRGSDVLDVTVAEPALIATLREGETPELRLAAAIALSWISTPAAQQAIAMVALDDVEADNLRMATFGTLAGSAKRFGSQLNEDLTDRLIDAAVNEPNLELRTAASQALGTLDLPVNRAAEILTNY
jgi:CheY-like chemotaxis protein